MPRTRSFIALENDSNIRKAAIDLIAKHGIDAISFRDVGRDAGLTHGALYARFEDVEDLLIDLWSEVLHERAVSMFQYALNAAKNPNPVTVAAVVDCVRDISTTDRAMAQVFFASRRMLIINEEVELFVQEYLEITDGSVASHIHSRATTLFAWMLGEIVAVAMFGNDDARADYLESVFLEALLVAPSDVADVVLIEPTDRMIPQPDENHRSRLLYQTFDIIGRSGYTNTTISRISRRAISSPGAIYKLYSSKDDLVMGTVRSLMRAPWMSIPTLAGMLNVGGLAQHWYSSASEQNSMRKNFALEIIFTCGYNSTLCASVERQLRGLESLVALLEDMSEVELAELRHIIRSVVLLTLGISFLSTVSISTSQIDLNQFAEPLRRAFLHKSGPSWERARAQWLSITAGPIATTHSAGAMERSSR